MTDTYANAIDIASIQRDWPTGFAMPKVIADIGAYLTPRPWGILGHWRMKGESFDQFWAQWLKDGASLDGQFGIFMEFASGAKYAIWYHGDDAVGAHPVVYFPDDNRDISICAPNIHLFFSEWASGRGIGWLEPFDFDATPEIIAERTVYGRQMLHIIDASPTPPEGRPHDELQARLTACCDRAFAVMDEQDRKRRLAELYGDRIDAASVEAFWPKHHPLPKIIGEVAATLKTWVNASVGRLDIKGQIMPDTRFDNAADLHEQFGFFLVDHRYREVAIWYHHGATLGAEPIVGFDSTSVSSDGDVVVLAPNLKTYLLNWADAVAQGDPAYGISEEPELVSGRPALVARIYALISHLPEPAASAPMPELFPFIEAHISAARAHDAADPVLQAIKQALHTHFPAADAPLWTSIFATVKGDMLEYSLTGQQLGDATFPEGKALTPLLFQARANRAAGPTGSLGPWKSAQLLLYPDGRIALSAYWNE